MIFTDKEFEIDAPDFYLCNAVAEYEVETERTMDADIGGIDGVVVDRCDLVSVHLGSLKLDRDQIVAATCEDDVKEIETAFEQSDAVLAYIEDQNQ